MEHRESRLRDLATNVCHEIFGSNKVINESTPNIDENQFVRKRKSKRL